MNRITIKHEAGMMNLKCKQEEAFEGFKKNILRMLSDVTVKLKSNILLHTQVVVGPFDAHKVDFDAFSKNSRDFYLEESPSEPTIVSIGDYTTTDPTVENAGVAEGKGREDGAHGDLNEKTEV
ncbi:hypothetical protein PVK06_011374 [Gossypium arboreum]|uniref:Uncharacterized protein n=1 Tax=Gossypium arboreum TaxID=29729 RepID=A0ABR0Q8S3_GOSAR|nr:hypothetical protein PVK06_011374 [Gossypium arboreum]